MLACFARDHPSARSTLEKPDFQEERLDNIGDCVALFAQSGGEAFDADRAAVGKIRQSA